MELMEIADKFGDRVANGSVSALPDPIFIDDANGNKAAILWNNPETDRWFVQLIASPVYDRNNGTLDEMVNYIVSWCRSLEDES
jgi:hypothetical protein